MKDFSVGDTVRHDFSKQEGEVLDTRDDSHGYNYLVRWFGDIVKSDWYKADVLERVNDSNNTDEGF